MIKLAHIVNTVIVDNSSDLFIAQPITFESMRIAKQFAEKNEIKVDLLAAFFPEDEDIVPNYFIKTKPLDQSVQDIIGINEKNKLPFIADILQRMHESSDAEYLIYTNVDIALMPFFYQAVNNIINQGYESFIINRRTIGNNFNINQMSLMYSEIGDDHPGSDCFIFNREMFKNFHLGNIVIGRMFVGLAMRANLISYTRKFEHFKNLHLTFHLGDNRAWSNMIASAFYNADQLEEIFPILRKNGENYKYQGDIEKLYKNFLSRKMQLKQIRVKS